MKVLISVIDQLPVLPSGWTDLAGNLARHFPRGSLPPLSARSSQAPSNGLDCGIQRSHGNFSEHW